MHLQNSRRIVDPNLLFLKRKKEANFWSPRLRFIVQTLYKGIHFLLLLHLLIRDMPQPNNLVSNSSKELKSSFTVEETLIVVDISNNSRPHRGAGLHEDVGPGLFGSLDKVLPLPGGRDPHSSGRD